MTIVTLAINDYDSQEYELIDDTLIDTLIEMKKRVPHNEWADQIINITFKDGKSQDIKYSEIIKISLLVK